MKLIGIIGPFAIGAVAAGAYILVAGDGPRDDIEPSNSRNLTLRVSVQAPESRNPLQADSRHRSSLAGPPRERNGAENSAETQGAEPVSAVDERVAAVTRKMADTLYARAGGLFSAQFAQRGLAPIDAKAVVRSFFDRMAECLFEAARTEAEGRSIDFDDFLAGLESALERQKTNAFEPLGAFSGLDRDAIETRAAPCVLNASQQAGIPFH